MINIMMTRMKRNSTNQLDYAVFPPHNFDFLSSLLGLDCGSGWTSTKITWDNSFRLLKWIGRMRMPAVKVIFGFHNSITVSFHLYLWHETDLIHCCACGACQNTDKIPPDDRTHNINNKASNFIEAYCFNVLDLEKICE